MGAVWGGAGVSLTLPAALALARRGVGVECRKMEGVGVREAVNGADTEAVELGERRLLVEVLGQEEGEKTADALPPPSTPGLMLCLAEVEAEGEGEAVPTPPPPPRTPLRVAATEPEAAAVCEDETLAVVQAEARGVREGG